MPIGPCPTHKIFRLKALPREAGSSGLSLYRAWQGQAMLPAFRAVGSVRKGLLGSDRHTSTSVLWNRLPSIGQNLFFRQGIEGASGAHRLGLRMPSAVDNQRLGNGDPSDVDVLVYEII